ncbi:MAG TPA: PKD domain-containing protein [Solirubrobacterales bacterium]|nr:PKD domain-containing protein [Solirubrobacterales bacterium]
MLHRQLLDRLLIAAAILAVWALAAPGLEAARADAAQVTVVSPGGTPKTLSLEALAGGEDVTGRSYVLRSAGGESTQVVTGFSLAALVDAAGADPFGFSYLEVQRPAGEVVRLSNDQALDGDGFENGPPVVYATATGTAFLRPSSGPGDFNANDSFEAPQGVTIVLRKGSSLRVEVEASTARTRPGKPVTFTAEAEGAEAGEAITYSWDFDDGSSALGPTATHRFTRPGSYDVLVGVTTPGDSTGTTERVTIQVGPPLAGPDRKGGGKRLDASAPDHGTATGTGGTVTVTSTGTSTGSGAAPARASSSPQPKAAKPTQPASAGERVSGELLSLTAPAEPEPPAQRPGARAGSPDSEGAGFGLSGAALGLLITGGLLGAGALTETRRLVR